MISAPVAKQPEIRVRIPDQLQGNQSDKMNLAIVTHHNRANSDTVHIEVYDPIFTPFSSRTFNPVMIKMGDLLGATTKCLVQTGQAMINRRTALPVPIDLAKLFESRPEPLHDFDETEELEVVAPQITMLLDNLSVGPLACPVEIRD